MAEFMIDDKTKVKRILNAAEAQITEKKTIKLIGIGNGSIKAVVLAEKLKKIFQNLLQTNAIYQKENSSVLEIILSIQE